MILKAHHSLVGGISGLAVFETLCDPLPVDDGPGRRRTGRVRKQPERAGWAKLLGAGSPGPEPAPG
ncbi:hypothetical protein AB0M34_34995 [Nocardia sp. NPDC050193]